MMKSLFLGLAALAVSTVSAFNWEVDVGKGGNLTFNPPTILGAVPGDTVTYNFFAKNHSVVQSSFQDPCHPLATGGFFSGFTPTTSETVPSRTTFTITINATTPIWIYCGQTIGNHCQSGMLQSINAPTTGNTFDAFAAAAKFASTSTVPGTNPIGGLRQTTIDVGPGGNLTYFPPNITELVGTEVIYNFNPKNHSVVQSSFADPCHPLQGGGFSSGFVQTSLTPSGVTFSLIINNTAPIWFYCAQTEKNHCQSGMVGSINAPLSGNTFDAFLALAENASTSTIGPLAPVGGTLEANGTVIGLESNTVVFNADAFASGGGSTQKTNATISQVPPPTSSFNPATASAAGGAPPASYNWAPSITDNASGILQFLLFLDNLLLDFLVEGTLNLTTGSWSNLYPPTIVDSINTMTVQSYVHRYTSSDSLQHYAKPLPAQCSYSYPIQSVGDWAAIALIILGLGTASIIDMLTQVAVTDPWMIPVLSSALGSKARMSGLVNMMHNTAAAPAVREATMTPQLAYSYLMDHYVVQNSCPNALPYTVLPSWTMTPQATDPTGRVTSVSSVLPNGVNSQSQLYVAWWGSWGTLNYTTINNGAASVPNDLYGYVWGCVTNSTSATTVDALTPNALTAPEMMWVTGPQNSQKSVVKL